MKRAILGFLAAMGLATAANAALVTYTLVLNDKNGVTTTNQWSLYADVTGGSQGLALYQVNLTGINTITTAANVGPKVTYQDSNQVNPDVNAGFSAFRAVVNKGASPQGGTSFEIDATQDTVGFSSDPTSVQLISGYGETAGSFAALEPSGYDTLNSAIPTAANPGNVGSGVWNGHLILATGTYTPATAIPAFSTTLPQAANVFTDISTGATQAATIQTIVPEPASLGLLAVAGVGLIRRRRRAA